VLQLSGLHYPNRIARYFFLAMEDVMGRNGLGVVLSLADMESHIGHLPPDNLACEFDFAYLAAVQRALEEMYGGRGGRGMALRVGRACFSQGFKNFGAMVGVGSPAFRALPLDERCQLGLRALADIFSNFSDQKSAFSVDERNYLFTVPTSPMAWGRTAEKPVCHLLVGILQECLRWASNGYEYHVFETACCACGGDACVFTINKTPIGQQR
jgi:hypothetical protein